ncbi:SRPBCC family protein [Thermobispora bispora]|uniref:SRPBCC family protein n=1 Tax=Thermobispora bispora TaxID=2006 RepID=UPI00197F03E5|nr:SRPBCC family protein [Thermobispora bispora]QSI46505.1 SRPBCC family protein [Thermobispora bispora]
MTEFERSRRMAAPAERVFEEACDVSHLENWIPRELHVREERAPVVSVHDDFTGEDTLAQIRTEPERLRMEWGTPGNGAYHGWLQVASVDDRNSDVTVHLSFGDEAHTPPAEVVESIMMYSLDRLAQRVGRAA